MGGHDVEPTGRGCFQLSEWRCRRCDRLFVSNSQYPGGLLPGDEHSDSLFNWEKELADMEAKEKPVAPREPKA